MTNLVLPDDTSQLTFIGEQKGVISASSANNLQQDEHMDDILEVREVTRLLHIHPNAFGRCSNNGRTMSSF